MTQTVKSMQKKKGVKNTIRHRSRERRQKRVDREKVDKEILQIEPLIKRQSQRGRDIEEKSQ